MRSWDDSRTCPAAVIRDILRGRLVADPDPHGLRLRGARISGRLDLENLTTDVNLELRDCFLEEGVLARGARLAAVALTRCQLEHPADPPLDGRLTGVLTCSGRALAPERRGGSDHRPRSPDGGCGPLLRRSRPTSRRSASAPASAAATPAQRLRPRPERRRPAGRPGHVPPRGFTATGTGDAGAVRLTGAHIGGSLECDGGEPAQRHRPRPGADGLQVGQDIVLSTDSPPPPAALWRGLPARRPHRRQPRLQAGRSCSTTLARP